MVLTLPLALLAVLSTSTTSSSASPMQPPESSSTSKQAHRYTLSRRSRTFADEHGMFDVSAFQQEKEMVAHKYAHSNARYRRNLEQGRVRLRSRRRDERSTPSPVYDVAKRQYVDEHHHHHHSKRQSSSSGGSTGSVELIDCKHETSVASCFV